MVHMHILQPAQVPLMPYSCISSHRPFGIGNCASCGQFVQTHKCTDRETPTEIILTWIPIFLIGIYIFPYYLSEAAVLTGPTLAVLCSLPSLTSPQDALIFLYVSHRLCKARPAAGKAGRLGSCEGGICGEEGRAKKACHWRHTEDICFVPLLIISTWQGPLLPLSQPQLRHNGPAQTSAHSLSHLLFLPGSICRGGVHPSLVMFCAVQKQQLLIPSGVILQGSSLVP